MWPCCGVAGRRLRVDVCWRHGHCVAVPPRWTTIRYGDSRTRRRPESLRSRPHRPVERMPGTSCASWTQWKPGRRPHQPCWKTTIAKRWVTDHPAALSPTTSAWTTCPAEGLACAFSYTGMWRQRRRMRQTYRDQRNLRVQLRLGVVDTLAHTTFTSAQRRLRFGLSWRRRT